MTTVDTAALTALAAEFAAAAVRIDNKAEAVVARGALNVKTDAVRLISGHPRSKHYPRSIGYDVTRDPGGIVAEIGPDKDRTQGALGNILEFGTSKNAPIPHLGPALVAEEPRFVAAMEVIAEDVFGL